MVDFRLKGLTCIAIFDVLMTFQGLESADMKTTKAVRKHAVKNAMGLFILSFLKLRGRFHRPIVDLDSSARVFLATTVEPRCEGSKMTTPRALWSNQIARAYVTSCYSFPSLFPKSLTNIQQSREKMLNINKWLPSNRRSVSDPRVIDESRFNLWDHDGRIRVRRYAGERCLPECVIERHSGLTAKVIDWGAISYPGRSNLLRIEGNLNSNRYVREVLQPEVIPFLQCIPGAIFQKDNAGPHVGKTVRDFCSAQHMQFLPWPTYSLDMSPVEHVWDLVDSGDLVDSLDLIASDLRLQVQKTNFCYVFKLYGILFYEQTFKICLTGIRTLDFFRLIIILSI
ncbi:transposable element Tc1 transposase [Trichonephila clavipes]|nr:transposable element Tc1 transposase [Trichonephila clavipes]